MNIFLRANLRRQSPCLLSSSALNRRGYSDLDNSLKFKILSVIPERKNDGLFADVLRKPVLVVTNKYYSPDDPSSAKQIRIPLHWMKADARKQRVYFAMTTNGLEIRSHTGDLLHSILLVDVLTTSHLRPLLKYAIAEGIFTDAQRTELGLDCYVATGLPESLDLPGPRHHTFYAALPDWQGRVAVNFNKMFGIAGRRFVGILNPIYSDPLGRFRYNPVLYVSSDGERFLRLVEWSTGEYFCRSVRGEPVIWQWSEKELNNKDPRYLKRLVSLKLWPSSEKSSSVQGPFSVDNEALFNLQKIVLNHVRRLSVSTNMFTTWEEIHSMAENAVIKETGHLIKDDMVDQLATILKQAISDRKGRFKHLASDSSCHIGTLATKAIGKISTPISMDLLGRMAICRNVYEHNPGYSFWSIVAARIANLKSLPVDEARLIVSQIIEDDDRKFPISSESPIGLKSTELVLENS